MIVHRSSLNYRLWKKWNPNKEPKNLCAYFWQSVLIWTWGWPVLGVLWLFAGMAFAIMWLLGYRLNFDEACKVGPCHHYKHDLYNFKVAGRRYRIAPWEVILPTIIIYLLIRLHKRIPWAWLGTWLTEHTDTATLLVVLSLMVSAFVYGMYKIFSNPLVRAYIKAKKEKICPMIEIVD